MKYLGPVLLITLMLLGGPALAEQAVPLDAGYPDAASLISPPKGRSNFNISSARKKSGDSAFPQGRNSFKPEAKKAIPTDEKPKKTICVGNDCGCASGKKP